MLTEYCGNIKVGSMYTNMGGKVEGWIVYVADGDGNYNNIGDVDTNIWIQKVPFGGCESETDELFIKGVEFFDKYAEGDMWDKCANALYWLSDNQVKASQQYCNILGFFFDLGKWHGEGDPKEYLKKVHQNLTSASFTNRNPFYYTGNEPFGGKKEETDSDFEKAWDFLLANCCYVKQGNKWVNSYGKVLNV